MRYISFPDGEWPNEIFGSDDFWQTSSEESEGLDRDSSFFSVSEQSDSGLEYRYVVKPIEIEFEID
jgi:hypothetical protein